MDGPRMWCHSIRNEIGEAVARSCWINVKTVCLGVLSSATDKNLIECSVKKSSEKKVGLADSTLDRPRDDVWICKLWISCDTLLQRIEFHAGSDERCMIDESNQKKVGNRMINSLGLGD